MKRGLLSMWTVYDRPTDHPDGFIARRFEIRREQGPTATGVALLAVKFRQARLPENFAQLLKLAGQRVVRDGQGRVTDLVEEADDGFEDFEGRLFNLMGADDAP
jgi:hypothetical protein